MEPFVLPGLFVTMVAFVVYVVVAWLRNRDQRALGQFDRDDEPGDR
jgi:hypothetical protein